MVSGRIDAIASEPKHTTACTAKCVAGSRPLTNQVELDTNSDVTFSTRRWVRPEDLNANGTLFGGSLLRWIDEESAIYAMIQLGNSRAVTKFISEINFVSSAIQGDMIEMGIRATKFGRTSITMRAEVRNIITGQRILTIDKIVFVGLDEHGKPVEHGYDSITYDRDRFPKRDDDLGF